LDSKSFLALPRHSPAAALRHALGAPAGLVAILDPADDPDCGGRADSPGLLRALLALSPRVAVLFAHFHDPEVVDSCWRAGIGANLICLLGGKRSTAFGAPVEVEGRVVNLTRGEFVNDGPPGRGEEVRLGRTALLRVRDIWIVLTEQPGPAVDPAFFALHGIDLARVRLLCVKAGAAFRTAFAARCVAMVEVDAPGPVPWT
jgi:microcystin degradation protein MlrC